VLGGADQYALACVAYQLLTGAVPFRREQTMQVMWAHVHAPVPSLTQARPDLPGAAGRILAKGMAKTPGERYASCGEFADALREALGVAAYHAARPAVAGPVPDAASPAIPDTVAVLPGPGPAACTAARDATQVPAPAGKRPGKRAAKRRPLAMTAAAVIAIAAATTAYLVLSGNPAAKAKPVAKSGKQIGDLAGPDGYNLDFTAFSRDGATIASFGGLPDQKYPSRVYLWNAASRRPAGMLIEKNAYDNGGWPGGLAFSADDKTLIAGDYDGTIYLWNLASRKASLVNDPDTTQSFYPSIIAADYAPQAGLIAEGNNLSNIHLLRVADRKWIATFKDATAVNKYNRPGGPDGYVINQVVVDPAGKRLAASDTQGRVYVWNTSDRLPIIAVKGLAAAGDQPSGAMALSPDGATLAVAMAGKQGTRLWDLAARRVTATLKGPDTVPQAVAFSPDGATLATGDLNGTIYLWDVPAGRIAATINSPIQGYNWGSLVFSPDGKTLAAVAGGGTRIFLYRISYTVS
jgi:WD40 repeat protein